MKSKTTQPGSSPAIIQTPRDRQFWCYVAPNGEPLPKTLREKEGDCEAALRSSYVMYRGYTAAECVMQRVTLHWASVEGLDATGYQAFVYRDARGWPFMVAVREGVLWDHYWQQNTRTWSPTSPLKSLKELKARQRLAMTPEEQVNYLPKEL